MKTPFPAYFFDASGSPFDSVRCRPCIVLSIHTASNAALISVGSLCSGGFIEQYVALSTLASTREKAAAKFCDLIAPLSPAPAEKSATADMAGAGAGDDFADTQNRRTSPADADCRKESGECVSA